MTISKKTLNGFCTQNTESPKIVC